MAGQASRFVCLMIVAGFLLFPATCSEASGPHSIFASPGDAVAMSHNGHEDHHHHGNQILEHAAGSEADVVLTIDFTDVLPDAVVLQLTNDNETGATRVRDVPETDSAALVAVQAVLVQDNGPDETSDLAVGSADALMLTGFSSSPELPPPR